MVTEEYKKQFNKDLDKLEKSHFKKNMLLIEIEELSHHKIPRPAYKKAKLLKLMPAIVLLHKNGYGAGRVRKWLARYKKFKVSESYLIRVTREVRPDAFTGMAGTFEEHIKRRSKDRP